MRAARWSCRRRSNGSSAVPTRTLAAADSDRREGDGRIAPSKRRSLGRTGMTAAEIVKEIEPLGAASTKKVLLNHGVKEPLLGVKIADLKPIQKRVKKDYRL